MEHVEYGNVSFNVWDCGGQEKVRQKSDKREKGGGRGEEILLETLPLG